MHSNEACCHPFVLFYIHIFYTYLQIGKMFFFFAEYSLESDDNLGNLGKISRNIRLIGNKNLSPQEYIIIGLNYKARRSISSSFYLYKNHGMEVGNFMKKLGGGGGNLLDEDIPRCGRMASQQPYKGNTSS